MKLPSRYQIISNLGQGGQGSVFLVHDLVYGGQKLVLKRCRDFNNEDELLREFQSLALLCHPGIAKVYDLGKFEDKSEKGYFITREYVEGRSILENTPLSWNKILPLLLDILSALAHIHHLGIVHGDLSGNNILVNKQGNIKIIDFGMASKIEDNTPSFHGSILYMAPEVIKQGRISPQSDLYSLGVILYKMMTGEFPFSESDIEARGKIPLIPKDIAPPVATTVIKGLLAPSCQNRYQSASEILELLDTQSFERHKKTSYKLTKMSLPFIGRDKELYELQELILSHKHRSNQDTYLAIVHGDQGIGVSRLLEEFKLRCLLKNYAVITSSLMLGGGDPYAPITQAFEQIGLPNPNLASYSFKNKLSLFEDLSWRLNQIASEHPIVLILDNMHLAHNDALELLKYIISGIQDSSPFFIIAGGRTDTWCARLKEIPKIKELHLSSLDPIITKNALIKIKGDLDHDYIDEANKKACGNPTLLSYIASAIINDAPLDFLDSALLIEKKKLSSRYYIDTFTKEEKSILAAMYIIGRETSSELISRLIKLPYEKVKNHVDNLYTQGYIRVEDKSISFNRSDAFEQAYLSLPLNQRKTIHAEYADILEHEHSSRPWQILYHLVQARKWKRARMIIIEKLHEFQNSVISTFNVSLIEEIIKHHPKSKQEELRILYCLVVELYLSIGSLDKARALAKKAKLHESKRNLLLGEIEFKSGNFQIATEYFNKAKVSSNEDISIRAMSSLASLKLKQGNYKEAQSIAKYALSKVSNSHELRASLLLSFGLACARSGDADDTKVAIQYYNEAKEIYHIKGNIAEEARCENFIAMTFDHMGKFSDGLKHYQLSVKIAEKCKDVTRLPIYYLNLGTSYYKLGKIEKARKSFHQGLRIAKRVGLLSTLTILKYNLGNLLVFLGRWNEAEVMVTEALNETKKLGLKQHQASSLILMGEIMERRGEREAAQNYYKSALTLSQKFHLKEEEFESLIHLAKLLRPHGKDELTRAAKIVDELESADMKVHLMIERFQRMKSFDNTSLEELERSLLLVKRSGNKELQYKIFSLLGKCYAYLGSPILARKQWNSAAEILEMIAKDLTPPDRERFWSEPDRMEVKENLYIQRDKDLSNEVERIYRLLDLNFRILQEHNIDDLLEIAMDTAIELTRATRGFLLIRDSSGQLKIKIARNIERKTISNPEFQFSRTIAERVSRLGIPVLTANAMKDQRFQWTESIKDLKLHSLLCVPVSKGSEIKGAIYLDCPVRINHFTKDDERLLLAFAGQVGIAMDNAHLISELRSARRRLEELTAKEKLEIKQRERQLKKALHDLEANRNKSVGYNLNQIFIGVSPQIQKIRNLVQQVAWSNVPVIIQGATGTGKELIARAIHENGPRKKYPFVPINCGAMPESLLESELFGHVRGAFTGAVTDHKGLFVHANQGTLFLDEIGDMSKGMQVKLLRVLQEGEIRPVGSSTTVKVNVRIIAASQQDLKELSKKGRFREDLYYRLFGFSITIPPLAERPEDIIPITNHVLEKIGIEHKIKPPRLTPDAIDLLLKYKWPGNVRELENTLQRACLINPKAKVISSKDLHLETEMSKGERYSSSIPSILVQDPEQYERERIEAALKATKGNKTRACKILGIPRATFYRKLAKYNLYVST
jgi:transcriptional regulator with GAF, ATPase, and Fis domain/serine/threonine protein kinase/Tfp pilus assembly protein PilF